LPGPIFGLRQKYFSDTASAIIFIDDDAAYFREWFGFKPYRDVHVNPTNDVAIDSDRDENLILLRVDDLTNTPAYLSG
jgi:hypothetical protein